jgi:hypothetical protein
VRRIFWLALGLGAGATAAIMSSRWVRQQAQRMAPTNLAKQAGKTMSDLAALAGQTVAEFRQGMADKEAEVRAALAT